MLGVISKLLSQFDPLNLPNIHSNMPYYVVQIEYNRLKIVNKFVLKIRLNSI